MSITYQVEKPSVVLPEMVPFFAAHWQEIAMNRDRVPLDVDYDKYLALGEAGRLHVVTVREDGKLVGYHVSFIEPCGIERQLTLSDTCGPYSRRSPSCGFSRGSSECGL
jgi:hypothetical protein